MPQLGGVAGTITPPPLDFRVIRISIIRMTLRILLIAGVVALVVAGAVQGASAAPQRRVVVVVDASAAKDPAVLSEARAAVAQAGDEAQLRVPRTPTEQLAVTHYFAAQGYT